MVKSKMAIYHSKLGLHNPLSDHLKFGCVRILDPHVKKNLFSEDLDIEHSDLEF